MKLGSLKEGGRDGSLIVVSRDLTRAVRATGIASTLQQALDDWSNAAPRLNALAESLDAGDADGVFDLDVTKLAAPLPRAYEFVDGSAYLPHVERVRRARNAERLRAALHRREDAPTHHPGSGATAGEGMGLTRNRGIRVKVDPREVGRVSQFVKNAQARKDRRQAA